MIIADKKGDCVRVALHGEIDHCSSQKIREEIDYAIRQRQVKLLLLDFSDVSFMDSSGVGMLIGRYRTMSERGGSINAIGLTLQTERLFKMAGLHRIIPIIQEIKEAEADE